MVKTPLVAWTLPRNPDAQPRIVIESNGRFVELTPSKTEKLIKRLQRALSESACADMRRMGGAP